MDIKATRLRFNRSAAVGLLTSSFLAACSGGNSDGAPPTVPQTSNVAIMLTSTGNDRLSQLEVTATSLTLTTQSGKQVDLIATPQEMEFSHLNGALEPLVTASLPQGTYISASVELSQASFNCEALNSSGGVTEGEFAVLSADSVPVAMSAPIKIDGTSSGLVLEMDANASAHYSNCDTTGASTSATSVPLTPTFQLRAIDLAESPTSSANGQANNLQGVISSVDSTAQTLEVTTPFGRNWMVTTDNATDFQGIAGLADAMSGMPVELDVAIHVDGTLQATRITVNDPDTTNLSTFNTELISVFDTISTVAMGSDIAQGAITVGYNVNVNPLYLDTTATVYKISGRFSNIQDLPFTATFDANSTVPGQRIYASTHLNYLDCCNHDPATTMTLEPQTIDGTVVGSSSVGNFTAYTIALASYDSFPTLAVQPGQNVSLQSPDIVVVYVGSSTQMLNTAPLANGQVLRFSGLVFDDNGALRMDCGEVLDGAAL